jgi:hypothetical protein
LAGDRVAVQAPSHPLGGLQLASTVDFGRRQAALIGASSTSTGLFDGSFITHWTTCSSYTK